MCLCVCLPITFYLLHPFNHADNSCHIRTRNGLKSYKWRPIRLTHTIYHHPSPSYRECKYNLPPRQPLEPRAATLYLSLGWERPSGASSVWKLKSPPPPFVSCAGVFNQIWPMGNTDPLHANPPASPWWQASPWQHGERRQRAAGITVIMTDLGEIYGRRSTA